MYSMNMLKNKFLSFILFALVTYSASAIGGMATIGFKEPWYSLLIKPPYNPPSWIFAPVWTTLYLMMTVAIWFFWHSKNKNINTIYIYFIHLIFNTTWSIVFFVFHKIFLALAVLIILILLILILMVRFRRVNMLSYYLMIPYLLWCFYALVLNVSLLVFKLIMDDVVIIGGGIIGAASAYFLSKEGRKVKVIERDPTYKKCIFPIITWWF